jgi:hypothetical protein
VAPHNFCITSGAGVDAAIALHKRLQRRLGLLCPATYRSTLAHFADDLVIGDAATRAANEGSERVCVLAKIEFSARKTPKDRREHACFDALGCRPRAWCKNANYPRGCRGVGVPRALDERIGRSFPLCLAART